MEAWERGVVVWIGSRNSWGGIKLLRLDSTVLTNDVALYGEHNLMSAKWKTL